MPRRAARRALAGLVAAGFVLGVGATAPVRAQTAGESALIRQFGGYELATQGDGVIVTYDPVGIFPVPPPVGQIGLPEARATLTNSPGGYALASLAWPGSLVANLGEALAQNPECAAPVPPYPIRAEARYPSDSTEQREETIPGSTLAAITAATASEGFAQYGGMSIPGFVTVGAINVRSRNEVIDGEVASRLRVELSGISVLGGLVGIESVVTDLVANSNGEVAATAGATTVSGATVLGQPATIDANGITLGPPTAPPPTPIGTIPGPIGGAIGGITEPLGPVLAPLNDLVDQVLGTSGTFNGLLQAAGIDIRVLDPVETVTGTAATRVGNGLAINFTYDGATTPVLSDLLLAVAEELPTDPLFPCSPFSGQGLLYLLRETHVTSLSLASGYVSAKASPAFEFTPSPQPAAPVATGSGATASRGAVSVPAFSTSAPALTGASGAAPTETEPLGLFGQAIPAVLLILVLLGSPLFGAASARLADHVLAPVGAGCPDGKQFPPDRGGV